MLSGKLSKSFKIVPSNYKALELFHEFTQSQFIDVIKTEVLIVGSLKLLTILLK